MGFVLTYPRRSLTRCRSGPICKIHPPARLWRNERPIPVLLGDNLVLTAGRFTVRSRRNQQASILLLRGQKHRKIPILRGNFHMLIETPQAFIVHNVFLPFVRLKIGTARWSYVYTNSSGSIMHQNTDTHRSSLPALSELLNRLCLRRTNCSQMPFFPRLRQKGEANSANRCAVASLSESVASAVGTPQSMPSVSSHHSTAPSHSFE